MLGLSRTTLQRLAETKYKDARLLFEHQRFSNSYYLAGYAVEIAIKAVIAFQFAAETIPDKSFVNSIYSHRFSDLIGAAGLTRALKQRQDRFSDFATNWGIVNGWSEAKRYEMIDEITSRLMIEAVGSEPHGVLPWLKMHW